MCKNVSALKNEISLDLFDFLVWMVNDCIRHIEHQALKYERYLGDMQDVNTITDDKELFDFLKTRLNYSSKLTLHYWNYERNCNEWVKELVNNSFNNSKFDNLHFVGCVNTGIVDSNKWEKDCYCFDDIFHAVFGDVSCFVSKRYDEVLEIEDNYKDLFFDVDEKLKEKKNKEEGIDND